jgi:hypothetical protein
MKIELTQSSETSAYKTQDAVELPRRKHTTSTTWRKFESYKFIPFFITRQFNIRPQILYSGNTVQLPSQSLWVKRLQHIIMWNWIACLTITKFIQIYVSFSRHSICKIGGCMIIVHTVIHVLHRYIHKNLKLGKVAILYFSKYSYVHINH